MNETEIYINGNLIDLASNEVIAETKQINNFFEIKDRQTSYTNTFKFKMTPKNKEVMSFFGVPGNTSIKPYRVHSIDVYRNGIPTIQNGLGLTQVVNFKNGIGYYSLSVQSDNVAFYDTIKDKKLNQLDFSSLQHDIFTEWLPSQSNTFADGYVYPLQDTGVFLNGGNVDVKHQIPCLFYKWVWDKIWSESGFTFDYVGSNNIFNSTDFTKRVFTVDKGINYTSPTDTSGSILKADFLGNNVFASSLIVNENNDIDNIHSLELKDNVYQSVFVADNDGTYNFSFSSSVTPLSQCFLYVNGLKRQEVVYSGTTAANDVYLNQNDEVVFFVESDNEDVFFIDTLEINYFDYATSVDFANYFSSISQKDFVKSVMQDYGLILQKQKNESHYNFITLNNLFFKNEDKEDWSSKFHEVTKIDTKLKGYGKENYLRYKYDTEIPFADGSFVLDNETLKEEVTVFTNLFKASRVKSRAFNLSILQSYFWETERDDDGIVIGINGLDTIPYSLLIETNSTTVDYNLNGVVSSYNGSIALATFKELTYNFIKSKYYNIYASTLNRFQRVSAVMKLNEIDIYNLDFFKLYYIDELADYFYINKVSGFKNGKLTKVDLVRIETTDILGEFNNDFNNDFTI